MVLSYGYTCDGGNRTLRWSQFCDGITDCYDRFDEEGHFCKLCNNNLYTCSETNDIRCDLACQMLDYVPCQTIQDRRACRYFEETYEQKSLLKLLEEFKIYIIACLIVLCLSIGIIILIQYLFRIYQQHKDKSLIKTSSSNLEVCRTGMDTLSDHIYEQCYEYDPPCYQFAQKYPLVKTYYEHVV